MAECPTVAIIQHESGKFSAIVKDYGNLSANFTWYVDVMQVAHHYFENGIAYFTRRINKCISFCMCLCSMFTIILS